MSEAVGCQMSSRNLADKFSLLAWCQYGTMLNQWYWFIVMLCKPINTMRIVWRLSESWPMVGLKDKTMHEKDFVRVSVPLLLAIGAPLLWCISGYVSMKQLTNDQLVICLRFAHVNEGRVGNGLRKMNWVERTRHVAKGSLLPCATSHVCSV